MKIVRTEYDTKIYNLSDQENWFNVYTLQSHV
jgi:hypothetical protein